MAETLKPVQKRLLKQLLAAAKAQSLSHADRSVLTAHYSFTNADWEHFASLRRIAETAGVEVRNLKTRHHPRLIRLGFLKCFDRGYQSESRRNSNYWRLRIPSAVNATRPETSTSHTEQQSTHHEKATSHEDTNKYPLKSPAKLPPIKEPATDTGKGRELSGTVQFGACTATATTATLGPSGLATRPAGGGTAAPPAVAPSALPGMLKPQPDPIKWKRLTATHPSEARDGEPTVPVGAVQVSPANLNSHHNNPLALRLALTAQRQGLGWKPIDCQLLVPYAERGDHDPAFWNAFEWFCRVAEHNGYGPEPYRFKSEVLACEPARCDPEYFEVESQAQPFSLEEFFSDEVAQAPP